VGGGVKREGGVGRPAEVGFGLGVGPHLPEHGVGVAVAVAVADGVGVAVGVAVEVGVGVGLGGTVGLGVPPPGIGALIQAITSFST
jgi:hypothetical protein